MKNWSDYIAESHAPSDSDEFLKVFYSLTRGEKPVYGQSSAGDRVGFFRKARIILWNPGHRYFLDWSKGDLEQVFMDAEDILSGDLDKTEEQWFPKTKNTCDWWLCGEKRGSAIRFTFTVKADGKTGEFHIDIKCNAQALDTFKTKIFGLKD